MVNKELLLEHILKSDLTATEKRYLEKLIDSVKWISVKGRLPEEIHTINYYDLVCGEASFTESDMVLCRIIYNREIQYVTGIFTGCQWYLYHDMYNEETEKLHVTHWMPLPEPPEQEGEEKS